MYKLEEEQLVPAAQLLLALLGVLHNASLLRAEGLGHALRWPFIGCLTDELPLLELPCAADEVRVPGELESSCPHENAPDAVTDTYVVDGGRLLRRPEIRAAAYGWRDLPTTAFELLIARSRAGCG